MNKEDPFENFRNLLLKNHQFPTIYTHKFIGKHSPIFLSSVVDFEKKFIGLTRTQERQSSSGAHLALTYEYMAASPDDVILLTTETHKINDLIYIL